jgi:hypothetical protein
VAFTPDPTADAACGQSVFHALPGGRQQIRGLPLREPAPWLQGVEMRRVLAPGLGLRVIFHPFLKAARPRTDLNRCEPFESVATLATELRLELSAAKRVGRGQAVLKPIPNDHQVHGRSVSEVRV